MSEKGLTYSEACKEVGRHGAQRRKSMRYRNAGKWRPAKPITSETVNLEPNFNPSPIPEHNLEQTFLDFN
jgi:hypothetical protein